MPWTQTDYVQRLIVIFTKCMTLGNAGKFYKPHCFAIYIIEIEQNDIKLVVLLNFNEITFVWTLSTCLDIYGLFYIFIFSCIMSIYLSGINRGFPLSKSHPLFLMPLPPSSSFNCYFCVFDFPGGSDGKASVYNAGDLGSSPGLGRSPGEGNGNLLQYCCLENPMDRGAWYATVCGVAKSWTRLSDFTSLHPTSVYLILPNCCLTIL